MRFAPFSKKQLRVLTWWRPGSPDRQKDAILCDGAVRSGKTLCLSLSFVMWATHCFSGQDFALCGKTILSLQRNLLEPLLPILRGMGYRCRFVAGRRVLTVGLGRHENRFYLFGGRDEGSASLIQGVTLGANGEKLGVMSTRDALEKAEEENLDLVLVSPNAKPAVCKIMNYGKYKFEQAKKEKEAKKKQKVLEVKELRVTPNIEEHDFEFKSKNARKFLEDGNKVKITVRFRGREVNNSKAGENVLNKFIEKLEDVATVEKQPKLEGRNMFTMHRRMETIS